MKVIFHIGMGKTGTTSLQHALQENSEALAARKISYLGMWFGKVAIEFDGFGGTHRFFTSSAEDMRQHADRFLAALSKDVAESATECFILSNEAMFTHAARLAPFIERLRETVQVSLIAWLREPYSWLHSAYIQWGILHKTYPGPIQSFPELAASLIGQYDAIRTWHLNFPDALSVRCSGKGIDLVEDFSSATGIKLAPATQRYLERPEPAEILLRALFNNRFSDPTLPHRFNHAIRLGKVTSAAEMIDGIFGQKNVETVVGQHGDIFTYILDSFDLNLLSPASKDEASIDRDAIRERLMDHLLEIILQQAMRITHLEHEVQALREKVG